MLELKKVCKTFNPGTADRKKALDNVDLSVSDGDFITIIGSNGAGKSTLFNAISGGFFPDSGRIILDGEDITYTPDFAPSMTVEENLTLAAGGGRWLSVCGRRERENLRGRVASLGLGLEDRMNTPVGLLSGGQRQALTLLMATVNPPKLLLLDEHTAALDPSAAEKILAVTERTVKEQRLTCLMVTHNMSQALALGNRTVMMNDGRIILDAKGEEREGLTVDGLLRRFREVSGEELDNDRILLS